MFERGNFVFCHGRSIGTVLFLLLQVHILAVVLSLFL
jgi:hypothetical protein